MRIPTLPSVGEHVSVLVVCLGNVCRSPVAERLLMMRLTHLLGDTADRVAVSSAGVQAVVGHPIDVHAAAELTRLGGDPAGFAATQLTRPLVEAADLVLTATSQLRSRALEEAPRALRRTFTLREFAAFAVTAEAVHDDGFRALVTQAAAHRSDIDPGDYDIPDPIGAPPEVHRQVADLLDAVCLTIASALAGAITD